MTALAGRQNNLARCLCPRPRYHLKYACTLGAHAPPLLGQPGRSSAPRSSKFLARSCFVLHRKWQLALGRPAFERTHRVVRVQRNSHRNHSDSISFAR